MKIKSPFSRETLNHIKASAMKLPGAKSVHHIYPRAYCIARPAPQCAVFVVPWMDSEIQVRTKVFSSALTVHSGVNKVVIGDWCSLAYVCRNSGGQTEVIKTL